MLLSQSIRQFSRSIQTSLEIGLASVVRNHHCDHHEFKEGIDLPSPQLKVMWLLIGELAPAADGARGRGDWNLDSATIQTKAPARIRWHAWWPTAM